MNEIKEILIDLKDFIIIRRKYWLIPVIVLFVLLGLLSFFSHPAATAPFIYTLF